MIVLIESIALSPALLSFPRLDFFLVPRQRAAGALEPLIVVSTLPVDPLRSGQRPVKCTPRVLVLYNELQRTLMLTTELWIALPSGKRRGDPLLFLNGSVSSFSPVVFSEPQQDLEREPEPRRTLR